MTEPQMSWRAHLLRRAQESDLTVHRDRDVTPASDSSWEEALRKQELDYMLTHDPEATLSEQLMLRLVGPGADGFGLPMSWAKLPEAFAAAVSAFSTAGLKLRVTGYSAGSTVVHFSADIPELEHEGANIGPIHHTALAAAAQELVKVFETAESEGELLRWAGQLQEVERFCDELQKRNLQAGVRYLATGGKVRSATLSDRGLRYLRSLREHQQQDDFTPIFGRITELRDSGTVRVKSGHQRNSPAWEVRFDDDHKEYLRSLRLGRSVHWIVRRVLTVDRLHREDHRETFFVRDNNDQLQAF